MQIQIAQDIEMAQQRITVSLPKEIYEKLEKIAEKEFRTVPNLLAYLAAQYVEEKQDSIE